MSMSPRWELEQGRVRRTGKWNSTERNRSQDAAHKNKRKAIKLCKVNRKTSSDRRRSQQQADDGGGGGMEGRRAHVEHGEDDAYDALVRVDCGQKGAATVRANKCLVVKMSHMAFCMWRPLSVGRTDSDMCVPRPNDARNERWKAG